MRRQLRDAPRLPIAQARDVGPGAAVLWPPRLAGRGAVRAPPVLPHGAEALVGGDLVCPELVEQVDLRGVVAAERADAGLTDPWLDGAAAPRRVHEPDGHVQLLLEVAAHVVAG